MMAVFDLFIIFAVVLIPAIVCQTIPENIASYVFDAEEKCILSGAFSTITRELIEQTKKERKFPENPSQDLKCFIVCVGQELQFIDDKGEYKMDRIKQVTFDVTGGNVNHDQAEDMIKKCLEEMKSEDPCDMAHEYIKCKFDELHSSGGFKLHSSHCADCDH